MIGHYVIYMNPVSYVLPPDDYSDDQAFRQLESLLDDASNNLPVRLSTSPITNLQANIRRKEQTNSSANLSGFPAGHTTLSVEENNPS